MEIELYCVPDIFTNNQPFQFACELFDKLEVDKQILKNYPTIANKFNYKKNELTYYWLIDNGTRLSALMFSDSFEQGSRDANENGWFIWLQTYRIYTNFPYKNVDELYTYWFDKYFDSYLFGYTVKDSYIQEAILNYKDGRYYACVCCQFPIIEFFQRRITGFDGESIFNMKKSLACNQTNNIEGYSYFQDFESKLNYYLSKGIYVSSKECEEEPKIINRNRTMHGIFTRNIDRTDCLKLFCIIKSMSSFKLWLESLSKITELEIEIENLRRDL